MAIFPHAKTKAVAGVALALSHYTISNVESAETLNPRSRKIFDASVVASQGLGLTLTQRSFDEFVNEFLGWYALDETQMSDVFDSMVAAAKVLGANWKTGDAGKEQLLEVLEALALPDSGEYGQESLRAVMRHMGID